MRIFAAVIFGIAIGLSGLGAVCQPPPPPFVFYPAPAAPPAARVMPLQWWTR